MTEPFVSADLNRFRDAIAAQLGLMFDDAKLGFLAEILSARLDASRSAAESYLRRLEMGDAAEEIAALAAALTVTETYFFRNREQFKALAEVALPARLRAERIGRTLRMLSAGCASGEEAYTLAIVARDAVPDPSWQIDIRGVDINPLGLEKARHARYAAWALRETPPELRERWFRQEGRDFVLAPAIRDAVRFEPRNLAAADPDLWRPGGYDVIFCRNVIMYFTPPQMEAVVARLAQSLAPGGFLFLGHAETLRGLSDSFHLRHTHETFYYQRKGGEGGWTAPVPALPAARPAPATLPALDDSWFARIAAATGRVAALTLPAGRGAGTEAAPPLPGPDLAPAFDLMSRERYSEALAHVATERAAGRGDPDLLLIEAMLLVHAGRIEAAEGAARTLIEIDELNAGARYVLALCAEQRGALGQAAEHDRIAAYLDPAFAMPRLHLGLLAKRAGDRDAARRELAQAQLLLRREDASRLLLFGGGFGRDGLMALCESGLSERGGPS